MCCACLIRTRNGIAFPRTARCLRGAALRPPRGLIAACFAMLLAFADGQPRAVLSPIGHGTRAAIVFAVGASIGWFVDREHRWQRLRLERVETERRSSAARMLSAQEGERVSSRASFMTRSARASPG